ncbi:MAG: ArsA-related P-loop ATPase [Pseudomonadota bacterium]
MEQGRAENALTALVRQRDLILVTGKGGVGKSTVTAALAELAVRVRGGAVAVESSAHPRLTSMVDDSPGLQLVNIDIEQVLPAVLGRLLRLPQMLNVLLSNRIIRLFMRTAPAVSELVLLDEVRELVERNAPRCPVIVDLPATGHALTLLGTPNAVQRMLRVGPVARMAERLETLFFDRRRCELVVVALPEELPVNETIELVQRAAELGMACSHVVVNQVPRPPVEDSERAWLEQIRQSADAELGRIARAARSELDGADEARAQIDRLRRSVDGTVIELPQHVDLDARRQVDGLVQALAT